MFSEVACTRVRSRNLSGGALHNPALRHDPHLSGSHSDGGQHQPRDFLLTALITAGLFSFVTIPLAGHLSDRFGRKRIYLIGTVATGIFGFIYFAMLNTMVPGWIFLGIGLSFVPHDVI